MIVNSIIRVYDKQDIKFFAMSAIFRGMSYKQLI